MDLLGALVREGLSVPAVMEVPGVEGAQEAVDYLCSLDVADVGHSALRTDA
jgi:hypothetical protein